MLKGAVAGRYSAALYEIASESNQVDQIEEELKAVNAILQENAGLQKILYHPRIAAAAKKELLGQLFKGKISGLTLDFIDLLVDRRRETFLGDIASEFIARANAARNIVAARVTSVVDLQDQEKGEFGRLLSKLTGKKVQVSYATDPSLIGGVLIRIGDKVIDGTIKAKLTALGDRLKQIS
ncbi:MAG: ATP synthase subunit delta [Pelotomaculum sp. PtaU1.Bin035]|nr:MAG: ATP synthase subunit delta [Pelotomaculum sp. PtaU1.Bin035]